MHRVNAPPAAGAPSADRTPGTLRWAVRLLLAEAAAFGSLAAYLVIMDVTARPTDLGVAIALTVFTALCALAVTAVARALARRSAAARAPAIVCQLMLIVIAYYLIRGGVWWIGVPVLLIAVVTGVLVVLPPTTQALGLRST